MWVGLLSLLIMATGTLFVVGCGSPDATPAPTPAAAEPAGRVAPTATATPTATPLSHVNSRAHGDGQRVASTQPGSDYIASCYSSRCRHGLCADVHTDHASDAQSISHTDSNVDV